MFGAHVGAHAVPEFEAGLELEVGRGEAHDVNGGGADEAVFAPPETTALVSSAAIRTGPASLAVRWPARSPSGLTSEAEAS